MNVKKRILFVDDDMLVLQGLQRLLRPMRGEWEMEFIDTGPKALDRMKEATFDAILSDMLMPGMSGAELLTRVKEQHPSTARLILSGQAELRLVMKCVGVAHQYLAKPCDADAVRLTLSRAVSPGFTLRNERLLAVLSKADQLPSLPSLYIEINRLIENPDVEIATVGGIINRDIGMTAQILKLVNSAFFGLRRHVSDAAEAVSYLGVDLLKSLVLSLHIFSQFESSKADGFSVDKLWQHSMLVAALAKLVAQAEGASDITAKEAFAAGMLHDAGKLILVSNFPDQMNRVLHSVRFMGIQPAVAEREAFGTAHAEVGGYLLGLWGLPSAVVEAITFHHSPNVLPDARFGPLTAVHVADYLAHLISPAFPDYPHPSPNLEYLKELGLVDRLPIWSEVAYRSFFSKAA